MLTFERLQQRLIAAAQHRLRNGEFTERGLARMLGISQPHLHNVLKGVRVLKTDLADQLLQKLGLTVLDLLEGEERAGLPVDLRALPEDPTRRVPRVVSLRPAGGVATGERQPAARADQRLTPPANEKLAG